MNDLIDIDQTMDLKARFVTKFSLKESTNQIEIEYILDDETWDSSIVEYKGKIGTLPTPSKKGFEFMGWYTEKDGTDKITEETIVDSVEKIKLYARWEKKTLEYLMVNSKTTTPNFNLPATTDETADGLYKMKDDYGVSYYFRDAASNNYVKFGKNANGSRDVVENNPKKWRRKHKDAI